MKVSVAITIFIVLFTLNRAQSIDDITTLTNNTESSVTGVTDSQNFYYSSVGHIGLIRISVVNNGLNEITAHLQQCYLPFVSYFTFGRDYIDSCTASAGQTCDLVVKACQFDNSSRYFVTVSPSIEASEISFSVKPVEEDLTNVIKLHDSAYFTNVIDAKKKYDFKSYKFEIPEVETGLVDVFVSHKGTTGKLNVFITANRTGDFDCSLTNATFGPGEYHIRLSRESLKTGGNTFYLSLTSNETGSYDMKYEIRIFTQKGVSFQKFEKETNSKDFIVSPYRTAYFESKEIQVDKANMITTFTLKHTYDGTVGSSRLGVSDTKWPNDLRPNNTYTCSFEGDDGCSISFESCKRIKNQYFYIAASPTSSNLKKVPLSLGYEVKDLPLEKIDSTFVKNSSSEWTFFELNSQFLNYSSRVLEIEINSTGTDSIDIYLSRGGITKGGVCTDEVIHCEHGTSVCKGSISMCDMDVNNTLPYLSIKSLPAFTSLYNLTFREVNEKEIKFNSALPDIPITTYETHMYKVNNADEFPGLIKLEFMDATPAYDLILSIVDVNESNCPIQSSCFVNSAAKTCVLPLICVNNGQQPYIKVTTNKMTYGEVHYSLTAEKLDMKGVTNGESFKKTFSDETWLFIDEKYDVNIRYSVNVTDGAALLMMYRDCHVLHAETCNKNEKCNVFANRDDDAYGGKYWLRMISNEASTSVDVKITTGMDNCVNVTTDFCGTLTGVDIIDLNVTVNDMLANQSYNALSLTVNNATCIKDFVCGLYFPKCGEGGVAPAICRENCIKSLEACNINSTCPFEYCEGLPECPIPPPEKTFYSGYVALIVIYSILAVGIMFTVAVIIIKRD